MHADGRRTCDSSLQGRDVSSAQFVRRIMLQDPAETVVIQLRRIIIDCNDCSVDCSVERCNKMSEYLAQGHYADKSCNIQGIRMTKSAAGAGLVRPRVIIDYLAGDPITLIRNTDNLLLRLGLEGAKAVVVELVSHAVEGAIAGGAVGAAAGAGTRNGGTTLGVALLGAFVGGLAGALFEDSLTLLEAEKVYGVWRAYPVKAA